MILLFQWLKNYLITNRYYVGLFFALFIAISSVTVYKFYIKNYYFVTPSSNELLGLSVIAFLISLYMIYKRYFVEQYANSPTQGIFKSFTSNNVSLYAKIPYIIALVVGIVALIEAIAGETPLYPKHYGTKALWNSVFVSALCCLHLCWLKISLYRNFYTHVITNKLEVTIYTLLTIPYIILVITFIPGGWILSDNSWQLMQAIGLNKITDWNPVFITMLLRMFHFFPYEAGIYITEAFFIYIPLVYIFSNVFNYKFLIYIIILYLPVFSCIVFSTHKDAEASLSVFLAITTLVVYIKTNRNIYLTISLILLTCAIYSRHNQISQIIILLIPMSFIVIKKLNLKMQTKNILYSMFLMLAISQIPSKLIFNNYNFVSSEKTNTLAINAGADIAYIAFSQNNLNLIPEQYRKVYIPNYELYLQTKNDNLYGLMALYKNKQGWSPTYMFNSTNYLLMLSLDYSGSSLLHHTLVANNFLNSVMEFERPTKFGLNQEGFLKWLKNIEPGKEWKLYMPFEDMYLFNILNKYYFHLIALVKYKYVFITYTLLLIFSFVMLNYKIMPNIFTNNKNMSLVYYITLSNMFLFIPLVILTPVGIENRYLLATYPLTGLAVLLFLQELPRYLRYYNRCITRFIQKYNSSLS